MKFSHGCVMLTLIELIFYVFVVFFRECWIQRWIQQTVCWIQFPAECAGSSKFYIPVHQTSDSKLSRALVAVNQFNIILVSKRHSESGQRSHNLGRSKEEAKNNNKQLWEKFGFVLLSELVPGVIATFLLLFENLLVFFGVFQHPRGFPVFPLIVVT